MTYIELHNLRTKKITTHQLAEMLYNIPDIPIIIDGLGKNTIPTEIGLSDITEQNGEPIHVCVIEVRVRK